jgi:ribosome-associated protein
MAKTPANPASKPTQKPAAKKAPAARKPKAASVAKPKAAPKPKAAAKPKAAPKPKPAPVDDQRRIAELAARYALEKKASEVKLLDLREITSMTDFFVICSASSDAQVKAIAENVIVKMRDDEGIAPWKSEGWDALQWIILDFVDFVVHVFHNKARDFYHLERLWADAPTEVVVDAPAKKPRATKKKTA